MEVLAGLIQTCIELKKTQIQGTENPCVTVQLYELQSVYICNFFLWIHHTDIMQNAQWCTLCHYWKIQLVRTR